ncbi:MAG: hypothetical protein HC796_09245, partial [Synechococcaceae cyanobacterium RL_1_2]|nr:hypothetical protein [Synechococcaceae cyanobacterium RL_1_2]
MSTEHRTNPPPASPPGGIYFNLKQLINLGLRRQLLIALCDNDRDRGHWIEHLSSDCKDHLVTIPLDLNQPNFLPPIADWLRNNYRLSTGITFQIVGIDLLTYEGAHQQRQFLTSIEALAKYWPQLDINLVLWVNLPWLYQIERGVQEFWQWHTKVFDFSQESLAIFNPPQPNPSTPPVSPKPLTIPHGSAIANHGAQAEPKESPKLGQFSFATDIYKQQIETKDVVRLKKVDTIQFEYVPLAPQEEWFTPDNLPSSDGTSSFPEELVTPDSGSPSDHPSASPEDLLAPPDTIALNQGKPSTPPGAEFLPNLDELLDSFLSDITNEQATKNDSNYAFNPSPLPIVTT